MELDTVSTPRARIACVSGDGKSIEKLTLPFKRAGYALVSPGTCGVDLCLVDLRDRLVSAKRAKGVAGLLRQKSPESVIVFLVDPDLDSAGRASLRRLGEVIAAGDRLEHLVERCRRILRLRNIVEETGERMKSLANLNRLTEFPSIETAKAPINVLIAGAPGPTAMSAVSAIAQIAGKCICVLSAGQVLRALEHDEFDCAVFLPTNEADPLYSVARAMQRHPKHCTTPVIQIGEDEIALSYLAKKGANEFMLARHVSYDLAQRVQVSAKRARLVRSMRAFLRSCTGDAIRDPGSGAFTSTFLAEHGARLCGRADQTERPLAAALVELSAGAGRSQERKLLHRAARLINRVTRAEDITARIGVDKFIVLCPATTLDDMRKVALRIEGVLSNTVFRIDERESPISVKAETNVAAREAGVAIEEIVARLMKLDRREMIANAPPPQSRR